MRKVGSAIYYYVYNGHGDVIGLINQNGTMVNEYTYDIWGELTSSREGVHNDLKYASEVYDKETHNYYLRARYYSPETHRFISVDTYEGELKNPLTMNQNIYCLNNPLIYVDPSGHNTEAIDLIRTTDNYDSQEAVDAYNEASNKAIASASEIALMELGVGAIAKGFRLVKGYRMARTAKTIAYSDDAAKCAFKFNFQLFGKGTGNLTSKEIRFTQDSIASTFKNGSSVDDLIKGLKSGSISPDDIPAIRIFEKDGVIYSLDNRRLHAFQEAGIDNIKTVWAKAEEIADETWKFTTKNGGTSIRVRGK